MIEFKDANDIDVTPLEYMIQLGANGNHVLFENERIKQAFRKREEELADIGNESMSEVREAINYVLQIPDFEGKKDYIRSLQPEIQDVLIYLYFQMIEKTMLLNQMWHH